ncbi:Sema domain [Parelaphostrongylus tenuis]|uniref:Sema domain n=1 Tax=Parelaphostrongylus tenuis TaxID=148309 RepID=A0AAD5R8M4_PARTN|nr:Sema domain [Parelaphostrongylus tenuis]
MVYIFGVSKLQALKCHQARWKRPGSKFSLQEIKWLTNVESRDHELSNDIKKDVPSTTDRFMTATLLIIVTLLFSFADTSTIPFFDFTNATSHLRFAADDSLVLLHNYGLHVLLGGRNAVFNVSIIPLAVVFKYEWPTSDDDLLECTKKTISLNFCDNYIRTFYLTHSGFVVCGTHGLNPTCANFVERERNPRRTFAGDGLAPYAPDVVAPFLFSGRHLYTANAPDYSSSELLLMRKDPLKLGTSDMLRTSRGETQTDGAQFVKLTENKHEVLAFFSEPSSENEGCGLRRVARIGRVCRDDSGGFGKHHHEWTSFVKSPLDCAIEGKDQDTLYFNQLTSVAAGTQLIYGAFRSQLAGLGSSAICAYSRTTISQRMAGAFRNKKAACPKANDTYEHTYIRNKPLILTRLSTSPLFVHYGKDRFTEILIQEDVVDLSGRHSTIFFVATDQGNLFKIVKNFVEPDARHVSTVKAVEAGTSIVSLSAHVERLPNQQMAKMILIVTPTQLTLLPSSICHRQQSCSECLKMKDPDCAWILHGTECVAVSENIYRREFLAQDVTKCRTQVAEKTATTKPPLQRKVQCLCESPTLAPCTTEVFQREVVTNTAQFLSPWSAFFFCVGLAAGALLSSLLTRARAPVKVSLAPSRIEAYATPTNSRLSSSMHSSIQTYC